MLAGCCCRVLQNAGAVMTLHPVMAAAHLCTAVFDGNLMLLKHLLMAGINANAADYDKRTALHIAAADSSLGAVSGWSAGGGGGVTSHCP